MSPDQQKSVRASADAWEAIFRAQVKVMRELQKGRAFLDLSPSEYDILFNLTRCPGGSSRLSDLNVHLLISQPSLSRTAERLEKRGYVTREKDPSDSRAVLVTLTDEGRAKQASVGREHVRHIHRILQPLLTVEQLQQIKQLNSIIADADLGHAQACTE